MNTHAFDMLTLSTHTKNKNSYIDTNMGMFLKRNAFKQHPHFLSLEQITYFGCPRPRHTLH